MVVFVFCFGVGQFLTIDGIHHFNFNDGRKVIQAIFQVFLIDNDFRLCLFPIINRHRIATARFADGRGKHTYAATHAYHLVAFHHITLVAT